MSLSSKIYKMPKMGGYFVVRWSRSKWDCNFVPKVQQNLKGPAEFGICKGNKITDASG